MANFNYIGNPDFRGFLAAQGQNTLLNFTGNDGGIDERTALEYGDNLQGYKDTVNNLYGQYKAASMAGNEGTGYASSGGGTATTTADPAAVAMYDQAIGQNNAAQGQLNTQLDIGNENINNSFQTSLNKLLEGKAVATRDYEGNKLESTQDNVKSRSNIDFRTGQRANSLQRLLGAKGSGSSTAARVAAPYAAALEGTQARNQVGDAFSKNMQTLDTNYGDYNRNWDQERQGLDGQLYTQRNAITSDVAGKRQNLLSQLAQLHSQRTLAAGGDPSASVAAAQPFLNQVNALGGEITQLGRQYAGRVNANAPTYTRPDLQQYNFDKVGAIQSGNTSALTDTVNPYLSLLINANKKDQTNGIPQF